jgi:hypothetical protein
LRSGSGIRCLFDPGIRDPGWVKSQDPDPGWITWIIFPRAKKPFFWIKMLKFFDEDPGTGMEKIRIRDPGLTSRIRNTESAICESRGCRLSWLTNSALV